MQLVTGGRNHHERERALAECLRVLLVQPALQLPHDVGGSPALATLVDEVQGSAVGHVDPDHPALEHAVEIAFPGLGRERELPGRCGAGAGGRGRRRRGRRGRRGLCLHSHREQEAHKR
jgi:hypothetical protein